MARLSAVEILGRDSTKKLAKMLRKKSRFNGVNISNTIIDDYVDTLNMCLINGDVSNLQNNTMVFCFRYNADPEQFQKIINSFFEVVTQGNNTPWSLDMDYMNSEMKKYRDIEAEKDKKEIVHH